MKMTDGEREAIETAKWEAFRKMEFGGNTQEEWDFYNKQFQTYNAMLEDEHFKVSPDTLLIVGANILGIILILYFEKMDIVTSKALGFIMKAKV